MLGAIAGDIIGSVYEYNNIKTTDFTLFSTGCRFTDDTVLTVALADTILHGGSYARRMEDYYAMSILDDRLRAVVTEFRNKYCGGVVCQA